MIIVSQEKDSIVNFDRVHELWIDDNLLDKTECKYEILADNGLLGCYKTKERAKEVLQEIIKRTSISENNEIEGRNEDIVTAFEMFKMIRYEMPEE